MSRNIIQTGLPSPAEVMLAKSGFTNQNFALQIIFRPNRKIIIFIFICVQHSKLHSHALCEFFFFYSYARPFAAIVYICVLVLFLFLYQVARAPSIVPKKVVQLFLSTSFRIVVPHWKCLIFKHSLLTNETFLFVSLFAPRIKYQQTYTHRHQKELKKEQKKSTQNKSW